MTRQIFLRLVSMFRGQERSFDYGPHNSARYDVCGGPHPADGSSSELWSVPHLQAMRHIVCISERCPLRCRVRLLMYACPKAHNPRS